MRLKAKTTGVFVLHRVNVENVHLMKCRINIVYYMGVVNVPEKDNYLNKCVSHSH